MTGILRTWIAAVFPREPLLRTGHLLAVSALINSGVGAVFWLCATHWYDEKVVGLSYTALAASTLLASVGQLNLNDFLVRFVPAAGRHSRKLVLTCYTMSAVCSVLVAAGFLALVPAVAPGLDFLLGPVAGACFIAATAGYAIFVLQDGALTAVRRPGWVVIENVIFAGVKILLLAAGAALALFTGILASWAGALVVSLLVANAVLLRRALPEHERTSPETEPPPRMVGYAAADYVGSLFRMAAYTLGPLMVLNTLGAEQAAYYSLAFSVGYLPFLVAHNLGNAFVVEAVRSPERLAEHGLRLLRHSALLLAAGIAVFMAAAPQILTVFGSRYAEEGSTLLRLLLLAALPNLLVSVAVDAARARRRLRWAVMLQAALCGLVLGLTALLLPELGITGAGVAWLAAQCLLAVPLLALRRRWLAAPPGSPS